MRSVGLPSTDGAEVNSPMAGWSSVRVGRWVKIGSAPSGTASPPSSGRIETIVATAAAPMTPADRTRRLAGRGRGRPGCGATGRRCGPRLPCRPALVAQVVDPHPDKSPPMRSFASALLAWLLPVPSEQPSTLAVSASDRSSAYRTTTTTARWRRGSALAPRQRAERGPQLAARGYRRRRVPLSRPGNRRLGTCPPARAGLHGAVRRAICGAPGGVGTDEDRPDVRLGLGVDARPRRLASAVWSRSSARP